MSTLDNVLKDESGSGSDFFDEKPKKSRAGVLDTSESDGDFNPKQAKKGGKMEDDSPEVLDVGSDSDGGAKEDKDEFDVSDSDDGGLASKVRYEYLDFILLELNGCYMC